jgi:leucyl-tRNA synthetase
MFLGPLEASKPWSSTGIEGVSRFLDRVWRLVVKDEGSGLGDQVLVPMSTELGTRNSERGAQNSELDRVLHTTIKKTREDVESLSFNTAIAQFMIFVNAYTPLEVKPKEHIEKFLQCLAPFAPHIAEELWHRLGHTESIHLSSFPEYDAEKLVETEVEIVLQVNSKIRGKLVVPVNASKEQLEEFAMKDDGVLRHLEGRQIKKLIVVPGKLVNVLVS